MIALVALGAAVGLVLALTGAGGGILAVPLLVCVTGIGVAEAAPVGLVAVGVGAGLGALLGLRAGIVRYRAALLVAAAGMLCAPLGLWIAHRIDRRALMALFAGVLLHVAWNSLRKADGKAAPRTRRPACIRNPATGRFAWTTACARALALAGACAGLLAGLLGVGGGFVVVPALQRCSDLPLASSVATSLAVIFLVSLHTAGLAVAAGNMPWAIALPFCGGALAGMLAGRGMAGRVADRFIHTLFAALAALAALSMLGVALSPAAG